jgi:hypothetical protein
MYDLIQPVQLGAKVPFYATVAATTGTLTYNSATYSLTNSTGTPVAGASGSVDNSTGTGTATVTVDKTLDTAALSLTAGLYILSFFVLVTGSDGRPRTEVTRYILQIPGFTGERVIYPTAADLQVKLYEAGLIENPPTAAQKVIDLDTYIQEAITAWENATGYSPFLVDPTDVTKRFDPPGPTIRGTRYGYRARGGERYVDFNQGLVSLTSVVTGVDSVSAGTTRTLNTDFYLYPPNAATEERPYQRLEFVLPVWGSQQSIRVTGKWGYTAILPDDVWQVILMRAMYMLTPSLAIALSGGLYEIKRLNYTLRYAGGRETPLAAESALWEKRFNKLACDYAWIGD